MGGGGLRVPTQDSGPLPCLLRGPGGGEGAWRLGQKKPRWAAVLMVGRVAVSGQTGVEGGSSSRRRRRRSSRSSCGGSRIATSSRRSSSSSTGGIRW